MGDITDMILDGILDEDGAYIVGFPIESQCDQKTQKISCEICGKKVKSAGLEMHKRAVHLNKLTE